MSKSIYTFNIEKKAEVEEKRIETYLEDGVEKQRTITEKVEKVIPIEILLKEPNRKQVQEAELVFSVEMSKSIKLGILTKNMLLNKYKDTGGLDGEKETKALSQAYADYQQVQIDIVNLRIIPDAEKTEDQVKELQEKENKMLTLRKEIVQRESSYLTLFSHTADARAQNKSILWYVLNLSYYKDTSVGHKDFVPIFKGNTFEEKEEALSKMEDEQDFIYQNTYLKLASLFSYWFFSGVVDREEFDKIIKEQNG
jgi:hypothetical protein